MKKQLETCQLSVKHTARLELGGDGGANIRVLLRHNLTSRQTSGYSSIVRVLHSCWVIVLKKKKNGKRKHRLCIDDSTVQNEYTNNQYRAVCM